MIVFIAIILSDREIRTVVAASGAGHGLPQQCMDEGNFGQTRPLLSDYLQSAEGRRAQQGTEP
jgi:hypothetical protein